MKLLLIFVFTLVQFTAVAQKFYIEQADKGAEKVIIDKLLENKVHITFKQDSADYTIRPNVKKMTLGRARGGIIIINQKTGEIVSKSADLWGSSRLVNGYDSPTSDVLSRTSKKYLMKMIKELVI